MAVQKKKTPLAKNPLSQVLEKKEKPEEKPEEGVPAPAATAAKPPAAAKEPPKETTKETPKSDAEVKTATAEAAIVPSRKEANPEKYPSHAGVAQMDVSKLVTSMVAMFDRIYFVELRNGQICTEKVNRACFMTCKHFSYCSAKEKILGSLLPAPTIQNNG